MSTIMCGCGKPVEAARLELGLKRCKECAFSNDVERPKGVRIWDHKTGGDIQVMSADSWKKNKAYFVPSGARSCVKNFSKSICA